MTSPRWCAIALPSLRIEVARPAAEAEGAAHRPLAVVVARPGGAVKDETSLLGNTRLDEVSPEAIALGVRRGQTIASARARASDLTVRVVHVSAVDGALAAVAEAALAFGAITSFEAAGIAGDVVWCDVTGCAHLFGGEKALAEKLTARVAAMGHACRVAVSDGPRIAAAAARFAPIDKSGPFVIPPGKGEPALHRLPLAALPLGPGVVLWIRKLGVRTAGDLARLPRGSLGTRLGVDGPRVMQLLSGDDRERLPPYVPPEVPTEKADLEYGVAHTEALVFVAKRLTDRLSCKLAGRFSKARRLELALSLDRALLPDAPAAKGAPDKRHPVRTLAVVSPAPLASAAELLRVLRARLESYAVEAPVLSVSLSAKELVPSLGQALDLFVPEARAERALPELGAELAADLGEGNVGTFALCDSWVPEERARIVPLAARRARGAMKAHTPLLSGAPEPSRWIGQGVPVAASPGRTLLSRVEAVQWWKRGLWSRDYCAAWAEGERAMAWIEVDGQRGACLLRGWMD